MWVRAARPRLASWESGYERPDCGGGDSVAPSLMDLQWDGPGILDIADIEGASSDRSQLAKLVAVSNVEPVHVGCWSVLCCIKIPAEGIVPAVR